MKRLALLFAVSLAIFEAPALAQALAPLTPVGNWNQMETSPGSGDVGDVTISAITPNGSLLSWERTLPNGSRESGFAQYGGNRTWHFYRTDGGADAGTITWRNSRWEWEDDTGHEGYLEKK